MSTFVFTIKIGPRWFFMGNYDLGLGLNSLPLRLICNSLRQ